jgi:serine/threonine protein phosphatase 1
MVAIRNHVSRIPANNRGRDFVVGDIHGCFALLQIAVERVGFDPSGDRLFAVGDLIDRGPDSAGALEFLRQPWAYAVRGNHEAMLLELHGDDTAGPGPVLRRGVSWEAWWHEINEASRQELLTAIFAMPIAIDIGLGQCGIVHADVPIGMEWDGFLIAVEAKDPEAIRTALWGRDRLLEGIDSGVAGVKQVFTGHSRAPRPMALGNLWAIDTGAAKGVTWGDPAGALTLVQVGVEMDAAITTLADRVWTVVAD